MPNTAIPTESEVKAALQARENAQNRFDNAAPGYEDATFLELEAAGRRLDCVLKQYRSLFCPEGLDKSCS